MPHQVPAPAVSLETHRALASRTFASCLIARLLNSGLSFDRAAFEAATRLAASAVAPAAATTVKPTCL